MYYFILLGVAGAVGLYYLSRTTFYFWPWCLLGVFAALILVRLGAYPPFFPPAGGTISPNRALGLVLYLNLFCGAVAWAAYREKARQAASYFEKWREAAAGNELRQAEITALYNRLAEGQPRSH